MLKRDQLQYFAKRADTAPMGYFPIQSVICVNPCDPSEPAIPKVIRISHHTYDGLNSIQKNRKKALALESRGQVSFLQAEDEQSRQRWIDVLGISHLCCSR